MSHSNFIIPPALKPDDRIAICAPAGIVRPQNVYKAIPVLRDQGWDPYVSPHTFDRFGTFAGTPDARLADLREALADRSTRAIMCARGGYGVVHLLEELSLINLRDNPKWIIGFSDISALHALSASQGVASIHGHMTSHLASSGGADADSQALFDILNGKPWRYEFESDRHNRPGTATGPLLGGNLSVISDLIGTPFNTFEAGSILFIEDVSEPAYKIERMLYQLRLSGMMDELAGLVVGQFAKCSLDVDFKSMDGMIRNVVAPYDFPVCYNAPIGHVSHNIPLVHGLTTTLTVPDPDSGDPVVLDQSAG